MSKGYKVVQVAYSFILCVALASGGAGENGAFHSFLMAGFGGFSLTFAGLILWYVCNLSIISLLSK